MARDRITAADRERAAKAADRARLRQLRDRVRELRRDELAARRRYAVERVDLLRRLRRDMAKIPRRDRAERRRKIRELADRRASFVAWWTRILAERKKRRAELSAATAEVRAWRKGARARIAEARRAATVAIEAAVERLEDDQTRDFEALTTNTSRARQELETERRDQAARRRTARGKRDGKPKLTAIERRREFTGGVEANLTNDLALATWRRARRQILAEARRRGVTSPDGVAEIVQEWTEADEDRALEYLQADADRWLAEELRKQGLAA